MSKGSYSVTVNQLSTAFISTYRIAPVHSKLLRTPGLKWCPRLSRDWWPASPFEGPPDPEMKETKVGLFFAAAMDTVTSGAVKHKTSSAQLERNGALLFTSHRSCLIGLEEAVFQNKSSCFLTDTFVQVSRRSASCIPSTSSCFSANTRLS